MWQRATTGTGTNSAYVSADRTVVDAADDSGVAARNITLARESTTLPTGSLYCAKITTTTANTNRFVLGQKVISTESRLLSGKTMVVSFYVRRIATIPVNTRIELGVSAAGAVDSSFVATRDATGQATFLADASTLSNSAFVRYSATFVVSSTMATNGFTVAIRFTTATSLTKFTNGDQVYIGQIQMEVGTAATDFNRSGGSILGEQLACLHYYFGSGAMTTSMDSSGGGSITVPFTYPTTMRAAPTSAVAPGGGSGTVTLSYETTSTCRINHSGAAATGRDFSIILNAEV